MWISGSMGRGRSVGAKAVSKDGKYWGGVNEIGHEDGELYDGNSNIENDVVYELRRASPSPSRCSCKGKMKLNTSTPPWVATGPKELNTVWGTADPGRYVMMIGDVMGIDSCGPICFCNGGGSPPNGQTIQHTKNKNGKKRG